MSRKRLGLQLDRTREELERGVVHLLQREAVAEHDTRVRRVAVELDRALGEVAQVHLALEVPEDRRMHLEVSRKCLGSV